MGGGVFLLGFPIQVRRKSLTNFVNGFTHNLFLTGFKGRHRNVKKNFLNDFNSPVVCISDPITAQVVKVCICPLKITHFCTS